MPQAIVTLSRAHKIAERMRQRITDLQTEALRLSRPVTALTLAGEAHARRLEADASKAEEVALLAVEYAGALAKVRTCIGAANEKVGIGAMLAEMDGLNRVLAVYREMSRQAQDAQLNVAEALAARAASGSEFRLGAQVGLLPPEVVQRLAVKVSQTQAQIHALADQLAEANASNKVTLELPEEFLS